MEFGLSHIILAAIAFFVGLSMRRKPAEPFPSRATTVSSPQIGPDTKLPSMAERVFKIVFLGGWLIAWTAGIAMAAGAFWTSIGDGSVPSLFVGGWLIAALAAWVWAAHTLIQMIRGRPEAFGSLNNRR